MRWPSSAFPSFSINTGPLSETHTGIYRVMRRIIGVALGFYFRHIERFHVERVPVSGPVLIVSNHPGSLTDSFVIGASVP